MGNEDRPSLDDDDSKTVESWLKAAARVSDHPRRILAVGTELAGGRFVVKRRLGAGGMGIVFEAFDRMHDAPVALKILSRTDAASTYRLKKEFRALADVVHPNLIRLHELWVNENESFFTMDLIEGVSFYDYVRRSNPSTFDEPKLRSACHQLAVGVEAIHRAGKLHRDLKPGNVLVTRDGRVVVLDFGLAGDLTKEGLQPTIEDGILGTPAYMAPEQTKGEPATEASDWYALGVMLYEALTGKLPFEGSVYDILVGKYSNDAPDPSAVVASVPSDLAALCRNLLRRAPSDRPDRRTVLSALDAPEVDRARAKGPDIATMPRLFIGREVELQRLNESLDATEQGKPVAVFLHGLSGMGKTTLVDRFVSELQARGRAVILRGRCYERESLAFNALDALIDDLSRHLRTLPELEVSRLTPRHVHALLRVFPVLQRVEPFASVPLRTALPDSPLEVRQRAFASLSQLLGNLADARPLVLIVDDLQWGDDESASLIADLLKPPHPPALLFVGCYRSDEVQRRPPLQTLLALRAEDSGVDAREIPVGPLSDREAARLVDALAGDSGHSHVATQDAGGSPFFLTELVRFMQLEHSDARPAPDHGALSLDIMLEARTRRLPEEARRMLEAVCVASRPTSCATLMRATRAPGTRSTIDGLRAANLVRSVGDPTQELVAPYHDRIRESVLNRLTPASRSEWHRQLANAFEVNDHPDLEALLEHLVAAGESDRASLIAGRMAGIAALSFAFERAAELYAIALEHCAEQDHHDRRRIELLLGRANALRVCHLTSNTRPDPQVSNSDLWKRGAGRKSTLLFNEAGVRAHSLGDHALMAQAALHSEWERKNHPYVSRQHDFFEPDRARLLTWALESSPRVDSPRHVSLMSEMSIILRPTGQEDRAEALCRAALAMADRLPQPEPRLEALRAWSFVTTRVDTPPQQTLAWGTELLDSARAAGSMTYEADARFVRLHALTELGQFLDASSEADTLSTLMSGQDWTDVHGSISHDRVLWSLPIVWNAMWLAMRGRFADAKDFIRRNPFYAPPNPATLTLQSIAVLRGRAQHLIQVYADFLKTRAYCPVINPVHADIQVQLRAASEPQGRSDFPQMEMTLRSLLASLYVDADLVSEVRAQLDHLAADDFAHLTRECNWLSTLHGAVKACVHIEDEKRAARLYEMLLPFEDRMIVLSPFHFCFGSTERCLGDLATTLGLWTEAAKHFDHALRRNTEVGARPFVALTQAGLARMLLRRNSPGDSDRAETLLVQASHTASELGMTPLQRAIERFRSV